jgi:hypothetical protein
VADTSSAIYLYRSTGNAGASWNFPGRAVVENPDISGTGGVLEDKELLAVDNHRRSPFRDRIYVTWANFNSGAEPPGPEVDQPAAGDRAAQQPEQPGEDEGENAYQVLLARSTDGGASFGAPVKVSDYNDLPDLPGRGRGRLLLRAREGLDRQVLLPGRQLSGRRGRPDRPDRVVVTFGSYINRHSNEDNGCVPAGFSEDTANPLYTGVKTVGACNNDIVLSVSNDGGASFTGTDTDVRELPTATSAPGQRTTDQWFQWAAYTRDGKLATSYYDRQYGDDELTGWSDFSLSGSRSLARFGVIRVMTSSMPPPTQFAGGFFGDYTGLAADRLAYPAWSDTRNPAPVLCPGTGTPGNPPRLCVTPAPNAPYNNDQEIYTAAVRVPGG